MMTFIPEPLSPGDMIGIVAPAGNLGKNHCFSESCQIIEGMGFTVATDRTRWPGSDYLADNDQARSDEFNYTWKNPEIKALFALRGGYGSLRIIEQIDYAAIRSNPKLFIGFSDITILLNHIYQKTGIACIHGPVFASLPCCDYYSLEALGNILGGNINKTIVAPLVTYRGNGPVTGKLIGGNLCSLVTLLGTRYFPDFKDHILFLEDISEPPYRLDRMLTQLSLAGKLDGVKGILVGDFIDKVSRNNKRTAALSDFVCARICELVADRDIPVWKNLPTGHGNRNIPMYIGGTIEISAGKKAQLIFN